MEKKKIKFALFQTDIDTALEIMELAKKHGKKPGDSMQEEFEEVKKSGKVKLIGLTDKDCDLLTGNLREKGLKILNLNEIERRKNGSSKDKRK